MSASRRVGRCGTSAACPTLLAIGGCDTRRHGLTRRRGGQRWMVRWLGSVSDQLDHAGAMPVYQPEAAAMFRDSPD